MDFMRDPSTANCRIYVGNLIDTIQKKDLEDFFEKFGAVRGVHINRGFGFVQFEKPESAVEAIKIANKTLMNGRKVTVKPANTGEKDSKSNSLNNSGGGNNENINILWNSLHSIKKDDDCSGGNNESRDFYQNKSNYGKAYNNSNNSVTSGTGNGVFSNSLPTEGEHNDCEIIVVSKELTTYAESIEARLKRLGLTVDLLFPNDDVPIGKVLANISSRGSLYAVLVTPQNEEHQSITVNILFGQPAEHRNMPVDDAINFLSKNFHEQIKKDKSDSKLIASIPQTSNIPTLTDRHPDSIQNLLNLLADNRTLTVLQYNKIIKYLTERRELQVKEELGDSTDIVPEVPISEPVIKVDPEIELQQKILSILNKPSITNTIPDIIIPKSGSIDNISTISLLYDPKVQKALDSLLQEMFN